ncbi:class I SAM-dependent methyltransferase [Tundrisphaera sp. TA3]|uniref:class I SAM-dependent methyltransferase n=1 Tax=Tundrisphaera sp. TA3 TaxID=3435775 RepID=UPI003EC07ECC
MNEMLPRRNLIGSRDEAWCPPTFTPTASLRDRAIAAARRFLDLQAGSIWRDLARLLPACRGVVLDVGAGAQPYRSLVGPAATYRAIDDARALSNFGYSIPDTTYYEGDRWPVEDRSVDVVLCTETLEHVADPATFLAEGARCLKPGGRLVMTVPFAARWHYIPHDYWRFTPSSLDALLGKAGFTGIAVYARGNALTVACYKTMALVLPLLFPKSKGVASVASRAMGLLSMPALVALAAIAAASMGGRGGDDCLGYTVVAETRA